MYLTSPKTITYFTLSQCKNNCVRISEAFINYYKSYSMVHRWLVVLMLFNATFNNISAISWWSVLFVEETGGPGENHRPVASHSMETIVSTDGR